MNIGRIITGFMGRRAVVKRIVGSTMVEKHSKRVIFSLLISTGILVTGCAPPNISADDFKEPITVDKQSQVEEGVKEGLTQDSPVPEGEEGHTESRTIDVHFIDVGQADSIFIDAGDQDILIDGGNNGDGDLVVDYLKALDTDDIEIMVGSHVHEDHIGGLDTVLAAFDVETIITSDEEHTTKTYKSYLDSMLNEPGAQIVGDRDMTFDLGQGAFFQVIETGDHHEEINNNSVTALLVYKDIEFLFTGDMEADVERANLVKFPDVEVLKAGHHGSRTSSSEAFLDKISPEYVVISAGRGNKYGHPHEETLKKYQNRDIKIYRTDQQGTIIVTTDGKN